jgi:phosphoribosylanthranilate isomerase
VTRIKVCGITRWEDAERAAALGVDALGFVFYAQSPRAISPDRAQEIIRRLPPFVMPVGVFFDSPVSQVLSVVEVCRLGAVQLHGSEDPDSCSRFPVKVIKSFRVKGDAFPEEITRYSVDAILLDTFRPGLPGGTGSTFPWEIARRAKAYGRIILAGGLNCTNVRKAIQEVDPFAVDVSSGVESYRGRKDPERMAEFVRKVKDPCRS